MGRGRRATPGPSSAAAPSPSRLLPRPRVAGRPGPRVIVCASTATIDPSTPDGPAIPVELRPARELVSYLAAVPIRAADALVPASDVIPADAIAALVTERGVLAPPTVAAIAALLGAAPELLGATPEDTG